jgi:glutamyl-Q tRNA(Asp) synthetase
MPPVGRFAPSPTGDLHFGSLLAALASYCEIRSQQGRWLLRIDDIDGPRSVPGSAAAIQRTLELYGFSWDGPVHRQSQHQQKYEDALGELIDQGKVFSCGCSRRMMPANGIYPGTCRHRRRNSLDDAEPDTALRMMVSGSQTIQDRVQGQLRFDLPQVCGDIIIWRRDKLVSYALACAVDDATDVSEVVRGADLLDSTGAQLAIMRYLNLSVPAYAHIPIAIDANNDKLSKHSKATPISSLPPVSTLLQAWCFLGQDAFDPANLNEFWSHAFDLWDMNKVPCRPKLQI